MEMNSLEQTEKKKSRDFNIYYLNFSKVYEIAMMINNVILTKIETDKSSSFEEFVLFFLLCKIFIANATTFFQKVLSYSRSIFLIFFIL